MTAPRYQHLTADELHRAASRPDGALRALFIDAEDRVVLRVDVEEGVDNVDELFLRHVLMLISDVGVERVAFVISRPSGQAKRVDKLLWRELQTRLAHSPTTLQDVVVAGEASSWSAAANARILR
jgi:DNA repair protein RadC